MIVCSFWKEILIFSLLLCLLVSNVYSQADNDSTKAIRLTCFYFGAGGGPASEGGLGGEVIHLFSPISWL